MDNISQLDELVPSRYAVQVSDIEVLVISDGVLPITSSSLATNAGSAEVSSWLDDMFLPRDVVDWPLNVVVVRTGGRTILVDAGLGVEFPDFPRAGQTVHRLEAAGIDPGTPRRAACRQRWRRRREALARSHAVPVAQYGPCRVDDVGRSIALNGRPIRCQKSCTWF